MTEIKCLDLARKIYEEAKIDREFTISLNKLSFMVTVDIAEQNDYNLKPFLVSDGMFDSHNLENELKIYLVACDEELAIYYQELARFYFQDKCDKYYVIVEELISAEDSVIFYWLMKAKNKEIVLHEYADQHDLDYHEKNGLADLEWETNCGNVYRIYHIQEISKDHFDILKKYLNVVY